MKTTLLWSCLVLLGLLLLVPGASLYYESGGGRQCARCHEIQPAYGTAQASSHRKIQCAQCHGDALTLDVSFHLNNLNRLSVHLQGEVPEQIQLRNSDVQAMVSRCAFCHRQEYADWQSGPHSASYSRIFLDPQHNKKKLPIDDCLRCHGMHYEGGIRDLVSPLTTSGPWIIKSVENYSLPSIPCLTCHEIHRTGDVMQKTGVEGRVPGPTQEINRPSLALFDRRTQQHIPVSRLPLPVIREGNRRVIMSPDQRQALCYQCHAPDYTMRVMTGDDRTGIGVHEGISCLACHLRHGQKTRSSCANCHPRLSNCGLDVETMDTTFRTTDSKHNIHWVKCEDCHTKGVPKKRPQLVTLER